MEFTKEQLISAANARMEFAEMMMAKDLLPLQIRNWSIEAELARIALASIEAEPVFEVEVSGSHWLNAGPVDDSDFSGMPDGVNQLYTAPPSPVSVPDESAVELLATDLMKRIDKITGERHSVATLSSLRVSIVEACRAAMLQGADGNSPVILDGWVVVPEEPTHEMLEAGDEQFGTYDVYRRMIAAAPKLKHDLT